MTALKYVCGSYEYHFPSPEECFSTRHDPMAWFWRLVHVLHDFGFIRTNEGGYFADGWWEWPWVPHTFWLRGKGEVTYEVPWSKRFLMAWGSLTNRVYF